MQGSVKVTEAASVHLVSWAVAAGYPTGVESAPQPEPSEPLQPAGRLDQLEGIVGALAGQVIVLLAQNRALQQVLVNRGVATPGDVRDFTLKILEAELDDLADQILPAELSAPVKGNLRQAIEAARNG